MEAKPVERTLGSDLLQGTKEISYRKMGLPIFICYTIDTYEF